MEKPKIDIIIPSYNDYRILRTIHSIYNCLGSELTRFIVIDGKSQEDLLQHLKKCLRPHDILISEKDKGIFDALNKGIENCSSDYTFWLGSDDFVPTNFDFNSVVSIFEETSYDCIVYKTVFFDDVKPKRHLYLNSMNEVRYKMGFHIPHFSSFWKTSFLKLERFDVKYKIASDADFFYKLIVKHHAKVLCKQDISTYMEMGGSSTKNFQNQIKGFKEVWSSYNERQGFLSTCVAMLIRYSWKIVSKYQRFDYPIIKELTTLQIKILKF